MTDLKSRRDGSPFMNMLMIAPLCDSRGKIRYFIGAQVDVSGLAKDCTDLETLQQLVNLETASQSNGPNGRDQSIQQDAKDDFQELSEMLNMAELETVRKYGGRMHREYQDDDTEIRQAPHMPRLLLQDPNTARENPAFDQSGRQSGRLSGIYQNVCNLGKSNLSHRTLLTNISTFLYAPIRPSASYLLLLPSECLASFSLHSWTR